MKPKQQDLPKNNPYDANRGGKNAIVRREIISLPKKGQPYASTKPKVNKKSH